MFMDFKQWRSQQQYESENEQQQQQQQQLEEEQQCAKVPRKLLIDSPQNQQQHEEAVASALPLFVSETYSDHSSSLPTSSSNFSRVEGRNQFSMAQWQELEVQAVIYRHMVAGAAIPPELLYFVKKSLLTSPCPSYLHQYPPQFHSAALMQAGYWGKGAMDAEPGRCRRTDGKKWRCSRDVVAGHKYCERHVHRGRNRSRKPVEFPDSGGTADSVLKSLTKPAAVYTGGSVAAAHFGSRSSTFDAFQLHTRSTELRSDRKTLFDARHDSTSMDDKSNNMVLMHFFDDHPKNNGNNLSSTSISISTPTLENSTSDFLRLSTGNGEELGRRDRSGTRDQEGGRVSWTGAWGRNQVASMGGPLAEAFRSSNNSSPTPGYHCSTPVA